MKKTHWMIVSVMVLAAGLLAGCDIFTPTAEPTPAPTPVTVSGVIAEGNLVPVDSVNLSFAMSGTVKEVLVEEGDRVDKGAVLARLQDVEGPEAQVLAAKTAVLRAQQALDDLNDTADLAHAQAQADLVQAKEALMDAEKAWDGVDTEDFQVELDDAQIKMNDAEDELQDAQQAYDEARWEYQELKYRYDQAEAQLTTAQALVADAQMAVDDTLNGPDPDALALAQATLDQANRQLAAAEADLTYLALTAPFAGKIVRMDLIEGAQTAPGTLAAILIDDSEWYVETNDLTEDEVTQIETSQEVAVRFDALPGQSFSGVVESISEYAQERYGDVTYIARIRLWDSNDLLRWGMTAEVTFAD